MSERWQRELKKLGGVDAPVSRMRAQIANGPNSDPSQPEPGRSPRQRITAGVVAFAVFAAAGVFAYRALKPATGSLPAGNVGRPLIFDLRGPTASPSTADLQLPSSVVSYRDVSANIPTQHVEGWPAPDNSTYFTQPLYELSTPVPPGTALQIQGDALSSTAAIGPDPGSASTNLPLEGNVGTLPTDPGSYVLTVTGRWASGTADFTVQIHIETPPSSTPSDDVRLDLNTTKGSSGCAGSPEAKVSYGDQSAKGTVTSYTWNCPGSSMVADTVAPSFTSGDFVHVPIGVHLAVTGDSTAAEGALQTFQGDHPWPTVHELGDLAASPDLPFEPGRYVLEVTAHWPNGNLHFYFPIELVPATATPRPATASTSSSAPIPDTLEVRCVGGAPSPVDPTVAVQADGLHAELIGSPPAGEQLALFGPKGQLVASGPAGTVIRADSPPGDYLVKCYLGSSGVDPGSINAAASITVVDPNRYWVSTELGCPASRRASFAFADLPGATAEEAIHSPGLGILASDTVEPAGYTGDPENTTWRVVRDGEVIASLDVVPYLSAWQTKAGHFCKGTL